jgi:hypothetical protein
MPLDCGPFNSDPEGAAYPPMCFFFGVVGGSRANRTLLPVAPTGVAIRSRSAGFGNRDRFHSSGKIGLHRAAGFHPIGGRIIVHRECRQWQHNVAFSGSIPLQPGKNVGRLVLPASQES